MNRKQIRKYQMLKRVRDFGAARRELFPETSLAGRAFAGVDAAVMRLSEQAVSQMTARPGRAGPEPTARNALLSALEDIRRTARRIKAADPAFDNKFHLPRSQPSEALLAAGKSFASLAAPIAELFVAREMPPTFIDDLNARIAALEATLSTRGATREARTAARAELAVTLASGMAAVEELKVLVPNRLKDDPVTLVVWKGVRRIESPTRDTSAAEPLVTEPAVSTTAVSPPLPFPSTPAAPDEEAA